MNPEPSTANWNRHYDDFQNWIKADLGIPDQFLNTLKDDDDWTFIIKLHSLIEASLNHLLAVHFQNLELTAIFSHLDTSNKKCGKIAFVRALKLLPEDNCKFVSLLSEIRNSLVHDARKFVFSIDHYLATRDKNQRKNFIEAASCGFLPSQEVAGKLMSPKEIATEYPRYAIFTASYVVATRTHFYRRRLEYDQRIDQAMIELGELACRHYGHPPPERVLSEKIQA